MRDRADAARARTLIAADGIVALSSGIGVLLIGYLIWHPVFEGDRRAAWSDASGAADRRGVDRPCSSSQNGIASWLNAQTEVDRV